MSICIYKNKANPAASSANVQYICRDSASDSISFHNLDELRADDRIQAKSNAINYAEQRELEEEARIIGNERGTPRNHNRMILSFDRKEETEVAKEEAHKFLDKEFPNQRAVVSVHQDQDKTHVHIWFDCRDIDTDKKTQIQPKDFYTLDEKWARQYDERYKTRYAEEYKTRKAETFKFKAQQFKEQGKTTGKKSRPDSKPERHADNKKEILKNKELNNYGIEKSATRSGERPITTGHKAVRRSKQSIDNSKQQIDRAAAAADAAIREATTLRDELERTHISRDRSNDRDI
jgi:hypothetical protein